jgi:23S rRNA (adenine2503-C2)-methyltransferase
LGLGQLLYEYKFLKKQIEVISDSSGLSIGHRMITVSTSGVVPIIERLNKELPNVCLAISLHATTDELRNELVPINKIYPLSVLINTIKTLPNLKSNRRLIFEYVMLQGVNDSFADADRLIELLKDLPAIVNLIPFNNWPNSGFQSSTDEHIYAFSHYLNVRGLRAPIRWSKGADILGACGQLRSTSKLKQSFIKSLAERQATKDNVINI